MIFITPYIIKNEGEAAELANKKGEALEEFRKEYRIEKKEGGPVFPQPVSPPSQEKPAAKTGSLEKNESVPAVQSAPTGSAAAVQSAPTGTMQPAPAEVVR
jgi:hypothetical protein